MAMNAYEHGLDRNPANHQPLTPLLFLERTAQVYPDFPAIVHGAIRRDYRSFRDRAVQLAWAEWTTRRSLPAGARISPGRCRATNGMPSR